jgi:hypothetical protein
MSNSMQCSICNLFIRIDNPSLAAFYQHVKHEHSHISPFHVVCRHPGIAGDVIDEVLFETGYVIPFLDSLQQFISIKLLNWSTKR